MFSLFFYQAQRTGGLFSVGVLMPFQGIFCRYPQAPSFGRFRLHIEKSTIQPQIVWNGFITFHSQTQTDISHLYQTIANCTQSGGRLICLELTGQQEAHYTFSMNARMPGNCFMVLLFVIFEISIIYIKKYIVLAMLLIISVIFFKVIHISKFFPLSCYNFKILYVVRK